mmetsp:Transcript_52481/g.122051  ORF Transcript_52481/g.122051 Transcript_52481/m.122051 type:complete len:158 (-) Transcript_52481:76-549(-)
MRCSEDWRRRGAEIVSGFAAVEVFAVSRELWHPCMSTQAERERLKGDCRRYASPVVTSVASSAGVFCLARCIGIARFGHRVHSTRSRVLGFLVAGPYLGVLLSGQAYHRFAPALEQVLCPEKDTALAARLRALGRPWAPQQTRCMLDRCERHFVASC